MPETFTPIASLTGGILIGTAAALMLALQGRIAGVSGITAGLLHARGGELGWRASFLAGLLAGGVALRVFAPGAFDLGIERSALSLAIAGLLVGYGTSLGSGCTSGHGVCGISRGSSRSITATFVFMATGMVTVFVFRTLIGGTP